MSQLLEPIILGEKFFSEASQEAFAQLSGDHNPLHVNELYARRSSFGVRVVHGVHQLLWVMDVVSESLSHIQPLRFEVKFLKPLYVGECAQIRYALRRSGQIGVEVFVRGMAITTIVISRRGAGKVETPKADSVKTISVRRGAPRECSLDEIIHCSGATEITQESAVEAAFPNLAAVIGLNAIAALLTLTYVVGMECPGQNSLLATITAEFGHSESSLLGFAVKSIDRRFKLMKLEVSGGGLKAVAEIFVRLPPVVQATAKEVMARVSPGTYYGQRVLIIGGSRGLGEVTAKILAVGGAHVTITFSRGQDDAESVANDIRSIGAQCEVAHFDVGVEAAGQLSQMDGLPTHVYYFATPPIFGRGDLYYQAEDFQRFLRYYVDGFGDLCRALKAGNANALRVYYPSSTALNEVVRGLTAYSMAKAAGEVLCEHLASVMPNLAIVVTRLPRILTDQTATLGIAHSETALDVLLPVIEKMSR
jgi:acyl dehydratase